VLSPVKAGNANSKVTLQPFTHAGRKRDKISPFSLSRVGWTLLSTALEGMTNSGLIGFDFTILTAKVSGQECPLYTGDTNLATKRNLGASMPILAGNRNLSSSSGFEATNRVALRMTESGVIHMKSNSGVSNSGVSSSRISESQTSMPSTLFLKTACLGIALLMLALPIPALAALGGDVTSVQQDQAQMKGTLKTTEADTYTTHEITAPGKTIVKEYVSPEGKVFAISWSGPFIPNMQQLLGTYAGRFVQAAKVQRESQPGHRPVSIHQPDFVFQNGGHMRSYFGRAYLPAMVPQGVNVDALQ